MKNRELKGFFRNLNPLSRGARLLTLFTFCSLSLSGNAQIKTYQEGDNVKNYSIIERPASGGGEYLMVGTMFGQSVFTPRSQQGYALHFMRVDAAGTPLLSSIMPNYIVTMQFDFRSEFADVRAVDIVPYTNQESIVIMQARSVSSDLGNRDLIVVLKVDNDNGVITGRYDLYSTLNPAEGNPSNLYATHAIYHEDKGDGNHYLYICGYDGTDTEIGSPYSTGYPEYTPGFGPSCADKRILVLKFDIDNISPSVVAARTWDYPWVSCSISDDMPVIYDFDMAMRLVPMNDGTGDIFVTGSTNSDFAWESAPPTPALTPMYGCATLVLKIDETNSGPGGGALETMALKPFIEHEALTLNGYRYLDAYEYGFDAFVVPGGSGIYVFSNTFEPYAAAGFGYKNYGETIRMTYVGVSTTPQTPFAIPYYAASPNSFVYSVYPSADRHRLAFPPIDYNWGTQVMESTNPPTPGANHRLYMSGLQTNWFCNGPVNGNMPPSNVNVNPFLAEFEPVWTPGSPSVISLNATHFWKTYFTQTGTNYFDDLGGGLSNIGWATQFMADDPSGNPNVVMTAPRWNNNTSALNHKFINTDANGDINTGNLNCDQSYQDCMPNYDYNADLADGWFFGPHTEDEPAIATRTTGNRPSKIYPVSSTDCDDPSYGPSYKPTSVQQVASVDEARFDIFPNPTQSFVNVKMNGQVKGDANISISLYSVMGQKVAELYTGKANDLVSGRKLNIPSLASGVYVLTITSDGADVHTERITIQ